MVRSEDEDDHSSESSDGEVRRPHRYVKTNSGTLLDEDPLGIGVPMPVLPGAISTTEILDLSRTTSSVSTTSKSSGSASKSHYIKTNSGTWLDEDPLGLGVPMPVLPGAIPVEILDDNTATGTSSSKSTHKSTEPALVVGTLALQDEKLKVKAAGKSATDSTYKNHEPPLMVGTLALQDEKLKARSNGVGVPPEQLKADLRRRPQMLIIPSLRDPNDTANPGHDTVALALDPPLFRREVPMGMESVPGSFAVPGPGLHDTSRDTSESREDDRAHTSSNAPMQDLEQGSGQPLAQQGIHASINTFLVPEAFMVQETDEENENNIIRAEATPMKESSRIALMAFPVMVLLVLGLVIAMVMTNVFNKDESPALDDANPIVQPVYQPTLQRVLERGVLRCGSAAQLRTFFLTLIQPGNQSRFHPDEYQPSVIENYCQALSAAIFNGTPSFEVVHAEENDILQMLANHTIDVATSRNYINMVEDVYSEQAKQGIHYCQSYLSGGTSFVGIPHYVQCTDNNMKTQDECSGLKLCINTKFKVAEEILQNVPRGMIVPISNSTEILQNFLQGNCNVMGSESAETLKLALEAKGYPGEIALGTKFYDILRFALHTLDNDPQWSNIVNAITMALLIAERDGITQQTADQMPSAAPWFGEDFKDLFVNAVAELGNFAELYMLPLPRTSIPNDGSRGLLEVLPLGAVESSTAMPSNEGTLSSILARGVLHCGVRGNRPGFAYYNQSTLAWEGMDVSYCLALAESLFGGTTSTIQYHDVSESNGFVALQSGTVDVLAGEMWTLEKDFKEPITQVGYQFSKPYFYGPVNDTRFEENLCLVTRKDDSVWSDYVNWVSMSILYAEKQGISQIDSNSMPIVGMYGDGLQRMFRDAIYAVGNYGELYERHLSSILPRGGRNQLEVDFPTYYYPPWN